MIRLERVHKRYGAVHAVRGVDLDAPRGQIVGILGPNGAGKSTTIRMITGSVPPTEGRVSVDGLDTVERSADVRRRLGYLPESNPLHPEMRVGDHLAYRAGLYGLRGRARRGAVGRALERCQLADVSRRRVGTLSKGYRQRVGLAAALLHDPPVLILDEPTSGLDPSQIAETRDLIRELAGDRTMLLVSHILPEVERTCDRIVVFARGRILADGRPEDLLGGASDRYVIEARRDGPPGGGPGLAEALRTASPPLRVIGEPREDGPWLRAVVAGEAGRDAREPIARAASGAGLVVRELRAETPTLETFYLRTLEEADRREASPAEAGEGAR